MVVKIFQKTNNRCEYAWRKNIQSLSKTLADKKKNSRINKRIINELDIQNIRYVENNSICGGTLENHSLMDLLKLRQAGIKGVVSFHSDATNVYEKKCKAAGLDYFNFPMEHSYNTGNNKKSSAVTDGFVKELKNFMKLYNNGNIYMGCNYGIDRTNIALTFNYLLNKKANEPPKIFSWDEYSPKNILNRTIKFVKKKTKRLSDVQKKELNLPKNLHDIIYPKIRKIVFVNKNPLI